MEGPVELVKKVLIIGESSTGKTCLVRKYVHGIFQPSNKQTIGVDFALKVIPQKDKHITLQIWDIAGQERYGHMTRVYFQSAVGALVVCDITRPESFDAAIKWKQDLDSKVFLGKSGKPVPALLLVNKCDLGKLHKTKEEMDALCTEHGFTGWYETSAKEDINVSTAFLRLVDEVLKVSAEVADERLSGSPTTLNLEKKKRAEKKRCAC